MTGVEILNQEIIYNTILSECWLAIGFIGIIIFFIGILCLANDHIILGLIFITSFGIFGVLSELLENIVNYVIYEIQYVIWYLWQIYEQI